MDSKRVHPSKPSAPSSTPAAAFQDPIPGLIPHGSLSFLVGPPKCGKTAVLTAIKTRLRDGKSLWGYPTHCPSDLGIITTDHKWRLNQGVWFDRAGFPDLPHVSLRDDRSIQWRFALSNRNWAQDQLGKSLHALKLAKGGFVSIDVAGVFIAKRLNDYNECLVGINIISQLLDEFQFTGLLLGHMSKQKANPNDRYLRPHDRILGSGAQVGFSDTIMYLLGPQDTGKPYHTFGWLPTHAAEGEFHCQQNPDTGLFEPYTGKLAPDPVLRPDLAKVIDTLPHPPTTFRAKQLIPLIMAACEVQERQAWNLLEDLVEKYGVLTKVADELYVRAAPVVYRNRVQ
jgi:hypothetical protein